MGDREASNLVLDLPAGVAVKGGIPCSQTPGELVGDMAEIDLPDGTTLDVGWFPEYDPDGNYRIALYRGHWQNQVAPLRYIRSQSALVLAIRQVVQAACQGLRGN